MDYKKPQSTLVQGGAGIYPLTTADQVILSDGSRLEKNGKISADSASDSAKLGGKAPEYYIQPRNLLDNSDFRNPVNQRGISSGATVSAWAYFIDRWRVTTSDITVTLDGNGMTIPSGAITQYIPSIEVGKAYTIAARLADGTMLCASATATKNDAWARLCYDKADGIGRIDLINSDSGNVYAIEMESYGIAYVWVALYEGTYTADTLPPYVPKGYAAELAECQRYYQVYKRNFTTGWVTSSAKNYYITVNLASPMRCLPSATLESYIARKHDGYSIRTGSSGVAPENLSVYASSAYETGQIVIIDTVTTAVDTNNIILNAQLNNLVLSADL